MVFRNTKALIHVSKVKKMARPKLPLFKEKKSKKKYTYWKRPSLKFDVFYKKNVNVNL